MAKQNRSITKKTKGRNTRAAAAAATAKSQETPAVTAKEKAKRKKPTTKAKMKATTAKILTANSHSATATTARSSPAATASTSADSTAAPAPAKTKTPTTETTTADERTLAEAIQNIQSPFLENALNLLLATYITTPATSSTAATASSAVVSTDSATQPQAKIQGTPTTAKAKMKAPPPPTAATAKITTANTYYAKNAIHCNAKSKEYYAKNREKIIPKRKKYYKKNQEETRKKKRAYYAKNCERLRAEKREYRAKNGKMLMIKKREYDAESRRRQQNTKAIVSTKQKEVEGMNNEVVIDWVEEDKEQVLLKFPFKNPIDSGAIDAAASNLTELSEGHYPTDRSEVRNRIEITVGDQDRLAPNRGVASYFNDTIINFWIAWITRKYSVGWKTSDNILVLEPLIFQFLRKDLNSDSDKCTLRVFRVNDIFEKKLVLFPIGQGSHWSLCVLVNPGKVLKGVKINKNGRFKLADGDRHLPFPCILYLDPLPDTHSSEKNSKFIRKWLNYHWAQRLNPTKNPFNKETYPLYKPTVPCQSNLTDCGVYVCRYIFAMYKLRSRKFSYGDAVADGEVCWQKLQNSTPFKFNKNDIIRIRKEIKTLIMNLHRLQTPRTTTSMRTRSQTAFKR